MTRYDLWGTCKIRTINIRIFTSRNIKGKVRQMLQRISIVMSKYICILTNLQH